LTIVGVAFFTCVAVAVLVMAANPFGGQPAENISITIDTPYVGQGVAAGTDVVMNGVAVGQVTSISSLATGGVRLDAQLQKKPIAGLTDTMRIDFRPINYFGVTGINIIAGSGGQALRDGMQIATVPEGNHTLQALLSRLGEVSTGVLTPQLIGVIDRATRYTDALNPLVETALIAADAVAQVQTVSTELLLAHAAGISVVLPSAVDSLLYTGSELVHDNRNIQRRGHGDYTDDEWQNLFIPTVELAAGQLFNAIGQVLSSHTGDLIPVTDSLKAITAVVPPLIRPEGFAQTLAELRTRFEKMYGGTAEQPAVQVRVILDRLPGVAAPLNAMGWPQ
jgi:hypothetical protein